MGFGDPGAGSEAGSGQEVSFGQVRQQGQSSVERLERRLELSQQLGDKVVQKVLLVELTLFVHFKQRVEGVVQTLVDEETQHVTGDVKRLFFQSLNGQVEQITLEALLSGHRQPLQHHDRADGALQLVDGGGVGGLLLQRQRLRSSGNQLQEFLFGLQQLLCRLVLLFIQFFFHSLLGLFLFSRAADGLQAKGVDLGRPQQHRQVVQHPVQVVQPHRLAELGDLVVHRQQRVRLFLDRHVDAVATNITEHGVVGHFGTANDHAVVGQVAGDGEGGEVLAQVAHQLVAGEGDLDFVGGGDTLGERHPHVDHGDGGGFFRGLQHH